MRKAGPEGKQNLRAWINGLNSHALAHSISYVFTHINYPHGLTPFFIASLERMKKINPTDPRNKNAGTPFRLLLLGHLTATQALPPGSRRKTNDAFLPECGKAGKLGSWAGKWTSGFTHHMTVRPAESSVAENSVFLISHFASCH